MYSNPVAFAGASEAGVPAEAGTEVEDGTSASHIICCSVAASVFASAAVALLAL